MVCTLSIFFFLHQHVAQSFSICLDYSSIFPFNSKLLITKRNFFILERNKNTLLQVVNKFRQKWRLNGKEDKISDNV